MAAERNPLSHLSTKFSIPAGAAEDGRAQEEEIQLPLKLADGRSVMRKASDIRELSDISVISSISVFNAEAGNGTVFSPNIGEVAGLIQGGSTVSIVGTNTELFGATTIGYDAGSILETP